MLIQIFFSNDRNNIDKNVERVLEQYTLLFHTNNCH